MPTSFQLTETVVSALHAPKIRCPYCRGQLEIPEDSSAEAVKCPSCGKSLNVVADVSTVLQRRAHRKLGNFELLNPVGVGAFGEVWKARDPQLDRIVAIKIPRKDRLDEKELEQFLREGRAAAQLAHPNIVSVYEIGRDEDSIYIVSEFIEGLTLADWLTGQRVTVRESAALCQMIAVGVHHAHEKGVIHRDLKPGNILLDRDGKPHIADFGLAKRESGDMTLTSDGQVLGTPAYMSPEQARGESHFVDRRSDVYSLGVILYELITGEKPFRGNSAMMVHQLLHEEPKRPRELNRNVPPEVEAICLKAMAREPNSRYTTASELADELGRFLSGDQVMAAVQGTIGKLKTYCRHPKRIDDASRYLHAIGTVLTVWAACGFAGILLGVLFGLALPGTDENRLTDDVLIQQLWLVPIAACGYASIAVTGIRCAKRSKAAIWLGALIMIAALGAALAVLLELGQVGLGEHYSDHASSKPLVLLLTIFAAIGAALSAMAVVAYYANPNLVRWAREDFRVGGTGSDVFSD